MISRLTVCVSCASLALASLLSGAACSSSGSGSTTTGGGGQSSGTGGPVEGPADAHCGTKSQVVNAASCNPPPGGAGGGGGSATSTGVGGTTGAGGSASEYGPTRPNAEADDDDCKYHLAWSATGIAQNTDVTFTAVASTKADGKPLAAGELDIEAYLTDTHPAPNPPTKTTVKESPTGTYTIGPIRFDAPGKWTVRFHIHENCVDLTEDSPHGHVAFFVNVP